MNFKNLGTLVACHQYGIPSDDLPYYEGINKIASSCSDEKTKVIASSIADFLDTFNGKGTAPANHLHMVSKYASEYPQGQEVADYALTTLLQLCDENEQEKKANLRPILTGIGKTLGLAGQTAKGAVLSALLASGAIGVGAGGIHWALNRQFSDDDDKNELYKSKIKKYEQLSSKLDKKLRKKYNYDASEYDQYKYDQLINQ